MYNDSIILCAFQSVLSLAAKNIMRQKKQKFHDVLVSEMMKDTFVQFFEPKFCFEENARCTEEGFLG